MFSFIFSCENVRINRESHSISQKIEAKDIAKVDEQVFELIETTMKGVRDGNIFYCINEEYKEIQTDFSQYQCDDQDVREVFKNYEDKVKDNIFQSFDFYAIIKNIVNTNLFYVNNLFEIIISQLVIQTGNPCLFEKESYITSYFDEIKEFMIICLLILCLKKMLSNNKIKLLDVEDLKKFYKNFTEKKLIKIDKNKIII